MRGRPSQSTGASERTEKILSRVLRAYNNSEEGLPSAILLSTLAISSILTDLVEAVDRLSE
jgi:hypothetical protein